MLDKKGKMERNVVSCNVQGAVPNVQSSMSKVQNAMCLFKGVGKEKENIDVTE